MEFKIKLDLKAKIKLKVQMDHIFLANIISLLKLINLDCINFEKEKFNIKFLKRFFLLNTILTRLFFKQVGYLSRCRAFRIIN